MVGGTLIHIPFLKLLIAIDWQPWIQLRQEDNAPLGLSRFGLTATFPEGRGDYTQVNDRS